jgi:hypothetical protein
MRQRNVLMLAALAALTFTFSLGVLVSRPAQAQTISTAQYMGFPHQSDIFQVQVDGSQVINYGTNAFPFDVAPDAKGRLPVVTQVLVPSDHTQPPLGVITVLKSPGTIRSFVRMYTQGCTNGTGANPASGTLYPGVMLRPGHYYVEVPDDGNWDGIIAVSGYWAYP